MATPANTATPKRSKPQPDILRDARRVRDILALHTAENRETLVKLATAALAERPAVAL